MKQTITAFVLLTAMLAGSACVKITDKDHGGAVPVPELYVEATETPNQFLVHLPPLGEASEIRRQSENHPEAAAVAVSDLRENRDGLVDRHANAGEKYRYVYVDDSGKVVRSVEVDVPMDLVIDRAVELSKSPDWHNVYRVIFAKSGLLTTNGFNVVLHAQKIESDQGVIRTFAPNQTAATGADGRNGGEIRIFAVEAHGQLAVEIRGENGGNGLGPVGLARDGGNAGSGGNSGNFFLDITGTNDLKISFVDQAGIKGVAGKGAPAGMIGGLCMGGQCNSPSPVGPGENGKEGIDGQFGQFCLYQSGRLIDCRQ
jgi:hypothetical protein